MSRVGNRLSGTRGRIVINTDGCIGNNICIASGGYFDLSDPDSEKIRIEDIALSLGNTCRFTGQCRYYSVAEHSLHCCRLAKRWGYSFDFQFAALMHDAAEAYTGDVSKPLKIMLSDFWPVEKSVEVAVGRRFGVLPSFEESVKYIDMTMLKAEKKHLFPNHDHGDSLDAYMDVDVEFEMFQPEEAVIAFLSAFRQFEREMRGEL